MGTKWLVMLLVGLFGLTMLPGCDKKADRQTSAPVMQVQQGGQLIYGTLQEPDNLTPLWSDLVSVADIGRLIFSGLVAMNDHLEWIPDLALEVPTTANGLISTDGLTVTYRLRPGVTWHDGAPFTAEDVKFTWQVIMNPHNHIVSRLGYDKIKSVDTPNSSTVVLHFKEPYPSFLTLFSTILPQHILVKEGDLNRSAFHRHPIGTGPFQLKADLPGEGIVLAANPNYWRGRPHLDTIFFKFMPDADILVAQIRAGEIDIAGHIPEDKVDQIRSLPDVQVYLKPNRVWEHLDFNLDSPLFQDISVRKAILLAIDRDAIVRTVMHGSAQLALSDQLPDSWAYFPELQSTPRDLNAAKALLLDAGWVQGTDGIFAKNGRKVQFTIMVAQGNTTRDIAAQMIQQQLRQAGIDVQIIPIEPKTFFTTVLPYRKFEAALFAWVAGDDPDDRNLWHSKNIPSAVNQFAGQNVTGWRNSEVDLLTDSASQTMDLDKRKQAYYRVQQLLADEVPMIPLYYRMDVAAVRKQTVFAFQPNVSMSGNLWNAWEYALFQSNKKS